MVGCAVASLGYFSVGTLIAVAVLLLSLLATRKGYAWYLWKIACGLLGLIVLAFLRYASKPDASPEVNQSRRQTGNTIGAVLSVIGLLGILSQGIIAAAGR